MKYICNGYTLRWECNYKKFDGLQVLSKGKKLLVVTSNFGDLNETKYTITITRSYTNLIFAILFFFTGGSFMIYSFYY